MKHAINFEKLRNDLVLKFPYPSKETIEREQKRDYNANPHNEPYNNKKPRRSDAEIVSDLSYAFADGFLLKQYSSEYKMWLQRHTKEVWGVNVINTFSNERDRDIEEAGH